MSSLLLTLLALGRAGRARLDTLRAERCSVLILRCQNRACLVPREDLGGVLRQSLVLEDSGMEREQLDPTPPSIPPLFVLLPLEFWTLLCSLSHQILSYSIRDSVLIGV